MAWQDKLALLMGANPSTQGLLGQEGTRAAALQGLMGAGASLLESSGPSPTPIGTGQAFGRALQAGQQGFQGAVQNQVSSQDLAAKRDALAQEQAARQELEALLSSGNVTDEALLRIATRFPQAQNVIQQYMKGRQAAAGQMQPSDPTIKDIGGGNQVVWDGKRWQLIRAQREAPERVDPNQSKVDALRSLGVPDAQIATALGVKLPGAGKGGKADTGAATRPGNARSRGAAMTGAQSAYRYASNLTGIPVERLQAMTPDEFEAVVAEQGGRLFQGPVMGEIPYLSRRVNSDIESDVEAMAAQQAQVYNETGMVTKADVDSARSTVANPKQPIAVQAARLRAMIEQNSIFNPPSAGTGARTIKRRGMHQGRPVIEYSNGDIEYAD